MRKNTGLALLFLGCASVGSVLSGSVKAQQSPQHPSSKVSHVKASASAMKSEADDAAVDRLNDAQLASSYRGPVYYPGQPVPQAQPVKLGQNGAVESDAAGDAEIDRLNDAQVSATYKGPVYYAGHPVPRAQPVMIGNNVPVTPPGKTALAGDANGDDKVDLLNASQIGGAYKGPVYYPGQPVPSAKPVNIATGGSAVVASGAVGHEAAAAPVAPAAVKTGSVLVVAPMAAPVAVQTPQPLPACVPTASGLPSGKKISAASTR
ncbi:hypothetical protein [Acetobacter sp.]|jgi:YHS domain-containing protein|uniref:hypothetical protein n=1 Tax=Acetobacter sp. TaxID=440 RepID=UPI0025BC68EA|nr:hypothetical protein [Acetobacter sp.]MCH4090214.1 hypothetical protein [Acetobacter sp.]MCI1298908.1 hypothetical protein [Acetobacter sp.]MCI1314928.1 hypothetical protein [Acetobacter sp.]